MATVRLYDKKIGILIPPWDNFYKRTISERKETGEEWRRFLRRYLRKYNAFYYPNKGVVHFVNEEDLTRFLLEWA